MIQGLCQTHTTSACILRYFNPVWAHSTWLIGEYPQGIPSNLLPYVMQTLLGYYDHVRVFGNDYDTPDGTAMRDYIHVMDLAQAHIQALDWILEQPLWTYDVFNIGTWKPYSVLDIIQITEQVTQRQVPYQFYPRRPWDVQIAYADPSKAMSVLWRKPCKTIPDAISDMRNFCQQSGQV